MFFILSKILLFFISPVFWIVALLFWAIVTRSQSRRKYLLVISFALFFLFSNKFLFNEVVRKWEGPVIKVSAGEVYDIGIVLGGFSRYDTTNHFYQLSESGDRLWQALYLYKTGKVRKLLISGGAGSIIYKKVTEADKASEHLIRMGVPRNDILVDVTSRNTRENAVESAKLINSNMPGASCLLITSAFHMKRSVGCFEKVRLDVTPYKADFMASRRLWDPETLIVPQPYCLWGWEKLIKEIFGIYAYKIAGYI